jgi:hypothetical protein
MRLFTALSDRRLKSQTAGLFRKATFIGKQVVIQSKDANQTHLNVGLCGLLKIMWISFRLTVNANRVESGPNGWKQAFLPTLI